MTPEGASPRAIGTVVHGRYAILRIVGRGGLGTVYQVADNRSSGAAIYALKELADPNPGAWKQFELESRWMQELDHESIPKVRESFVWEGRAYLVMDFVDGENLERYLQRTGKPASEAQALRLMLPICDALAYLHMRNPPLLHRDVKPANIIVTPEGRPVLVDFGIAKAHLPGMNQTVTFVRKAGTEGYAPPEQYAATGMTGPWSDVYALGATLYQLLTGRVPKTAVERITETDEMPGPRSLIPSISVLTDRTVMKALELKPVDRYQTVTQFAASLMEALNMLTAVRGGGPTPVFNSFPGSSPSSVSFAGPSAPSQAPQAQTHLPPLGEPLPSNLQTGSHLDAGGRVMAATRSPVYSSAPSIPPPPDAFGGMISGPMGEGRPQTMPAMSPVVSRPDVARNKSSRATSTSRRQPLILAVVILVLVGLAGLSVFAYRTFGPIDRSSPSATVSGYFSALGQRDYAKAWQYDALSRNDTTSQSAFTQELQADDASYGVVRNAQIQQITEDGSQATATVAVTRASVSGPMTYSVQLAEYDGSTWLIVAIASQ